MTPSGAAPQILFLVKSHPERTSKPAEVIRMSAGIRPWGRVRVHVCLMDEAVLALSEFAEEFLEGDLFRQHLPDLAVPNNPLLVLADEPRLRELGEISLAYRSIDAGELAALMAECLWVCRI